jgi:DNA-binding GntR family transcriptional regulator
MESADEAQTFPVFDQTSSRTGSRADFVFESLRDAIWDGRIARGHRVREEEIARNMRVSRTPVREALQRLQQRGLLVLGAGRGLMVAELRPDQVVELYAMREVLEGSAARFAAQRATEVEIAHLSQLQRELQNTNKEGTKVVMLNRQFHQVMYHAAHNQYLMQTLDLLHDSFALLNHTVFSMPKRKESDEEHQKILEAIERRAPDKAEQAARIHIRNSQQMRIGSTAIGIKRHFDQS